MTDEEATHLIATFRKLFPACTSEQAFVLKREFAKYTAPVVERAIDRYALRHELVSVARLVDLIKEMRPAGEGPRQESKRWKAEFESDQKRLESALNGCSEQDLTSLKASAVEAADPACRAFLQGCDPHSSPVLRPLMYQRLLKQQRRRPEPTTVVKH